MVEYLPREMKPPLLIIDRKKRKIFGNEAQAPSNEQNNAVTMTRRTWKLEVTFHQ